MSISSIIRKVESIETLKSRKAEEKALVVWAKKILVMGDNAIEYKEIGLAPYYEFCPIKRCLEYMGQYMRYEKYASFKKGVPPPPLLSWVAVPDISDFLSFAHYANGNIEAIESLGGQIPSEYYWLKESGCPTAATILKGIFIETVKALPAAAILKLLGYKVAVKTY
jgi:hypothetical protein